MPTLECTVIPTQLSRAFADYRKIVDDDFSPQTVSNVLFTAMDAAARIWLYARQRGVEIPPFEAFAAMATESIRGYATVLKRGASVVPADPVEQ